MKFLVLFALTLATTSVVPISATKGRISNGKNATIGQFPYQVGLSFHRGFGSPEQRCGGCLIEHTWVVTSALCAEFQDSVDVYLGNITFGTSEVNYTVKSSKFIFHPGYNRTFANNLVLIEIPYTNFTTNITKANLPSISNANLTYEGNYAIASGWGRTNSSPNMAKYLQWGRMPVINNTECNKTYHPFVLPSNICAASPDHVSICEGDFGGPLVLENSNNTLIGVGSFWNGNCGDPVILSRVTSYLDWIRNNTGIKL